jgi:hypothetical protein
MHIIILSQMGWLGGKKFDFHPSGSRFNFHEWHGLWSMVDVDQIFPTYLAYLN